MCVKSLMGEPTTQEGLCQDEALGRCDFKPWCSFHLTLSHPILTGLSASLCLGARELPTHSTCFLLLAVWLAGIVSFLKGIAVLW